MFVAEMSSDSYQLLGMAERGMLPAFFARRLRHGTLLEGILFSASGVLLLSSMTFQEIVAAENFLYGFGMLLEFLAFVLLRVRRARTGSRSGPPGAWQCWCCPRR
jgi:amino acid transporter